MSQIIRFKVCEREDWQEKIATDNICTEVEKVEVFVHIVVAFMMKYSVFWEVDHCDSAVEFFEKFPDTKLTIQYGNCNWDNNLTLWEPALHTERIDELYKATIEHERKEIDFLRKKMSAERSNVATIRTKVQDEMGVPTPMQWDEMVGSYEDTNNGRSYDQESGYGTHYEEGYDSY